MRKIYPIIGMIIPLLYISTVLIGGFIRNDYSHIANTISELTIYNAPYRIFVSVLFILDSFLIIIFGLEIFLHYKATNIKEVTNFCIIFIIFGILSVLVIFFSQDVRGQDSTLPGIIHLIISNLKILSIAVAIIQASIWFKHDIRFKRLILFSVISSIFIIVMGALTFIEFIRGSDFVGLYERIIYGFIMLWFLIISIKLYVIENYLNN